MAVPQAALMSATRHSIDVKANGEVSRMRSHRGNMPSLPQTKYCSLCPAKFTRTTHLNRHLRSHTNERSHRCDTCGAEFTRSDLLTRHKRTCGDSRNTNRSRRKSCQACAESKVKCNLQFPCSKCTSRGKECVFINDPETSRNKRNASRRSTQRSSSTLSSSSVTSTATSSVIGSDTDRPSSARYSSPYMAGTSIATSPLLSPSAFPPTQFTNVRPMGPPSLSNSSSSSPPSSSRGSPRMDFFDGQGDSNVSLDLGFDSIALDTQLTRLFPNGLFEPFVEEATLSSCAPPVEQHGDLASWMDGSEHYSGYGSDGPFSLSQSLGIEGQDMVAGYSALQNSGGAANPPSGSVSGHVFPMVPNSEFVSSATLRENESPGSEELDQYLYLFFSAFCSQIPLIHRATWRADGKPYVLIRAMQACGALFVKSPSAVRFINETVATSRDALVLEFSKPNLDIGEQVHLIIAIVLLQTIGLFHQCPDQQMSTNIYHGMLVMMIRRTDLLARIGSWTPADLTDLQSLEGAWKDWTRYESIKRALFMSYLHDCSHCMYFSMSPSFQPIEFDINLPCDDTLWVAGTAREWYQAVQTPSPYGTGPPRTAGVNMQIALDALTDTRPCTDSLPLNSFSYFILIHTILRNIYAPRTVTASPDGLFLAHSPNLLAPSSQGNQKDDMYTVQFALHNWLSLWTSSPEATRFENTGVEPPFICDVLPFYWLAQAVVAFPEGIDGLAPNSFEGQDESGRCQLLKKWLDHIRVFVRTGAQVPTLLWDDLMRIRNQLSQRTAGQACSPQSGGVISFFSLS